MLDNCSIDTLSIEIYENQIFNFDFHPICVYMFEFSFLTILNMYRIILRAVTVDAPQCKSFSQSYCEPKTYALVHLALQVVVAFVRCRVL